MKLVKLASTLRGLEEGSRDIKEGLELMRDADNSLQKLVIELAVKVDKKSRKIIDMYSQEVRDGIEASVYSLQEAKSNFRRVIKHIQKLEVN